MSAGSPKGEAMFETRILSSPKFCSWAEGLFGFLLGSCIF